MRQGGCLPDDVVARLQGRFPGPDHAVLLDALEALCQRFGERVVRAVLVLGDGDPGRLHHFMEAARQDPRDVLYWAEYDNDDRRVRDCSRPFTPDRRAR